MFSSPDFERIFWDIATQTPLALALLGTALFLLAKRHKAPRPCTIAASTFLGLFVFNLLLYFFREWLTEHVNQLTNNPNGTWLISSWNDFTLVWRLTNVFSVCVHAIGVGVLGWCVTMERKAVGRAD